jgi:hypothetical protein
MTTFVNIVYKVNAAAVVIIIIIIAELRFVINVKF